MSLSLRTRTLVLFLAFVLVPLGAVGVVASVGTRLAVQRAVEQTLESANGAPTGEPADQLRGQPATLPPVEIDRITAPLDRVLVAYVALMLLVGAAAALGFRLVSRRIFNSLEEFRGAVEQIAEGDFAPWLPPPGKDEVGWMSLALRRMTERLGKMMKSMEQSGRLAVVGEMAAQMAHEVRTPLSSIKMNLQALDRAVDAGTVPADARASIETSLSEIGRLEAVVDRMLGFGLPVRGSRSRCRLHELIDEAADLIRGPLGKGSVALRLDLAAESDWILADRGRVKGVFLNLLVNARDAMPDGGEIVIETHLFMGEGGRQMVAAAVSDSGPGVPAGLREEIFHPFFTTKAEGCGIGLPAALRTLREHGGDLYLGRRPNGLAGACFVVVFPLVPAVEVAESSDLIYADPYERGPAARGTSQGPEARPEWTGMSAFLQRGDFPRPSQEEGSGRGRDPEGDRDGPDETTEWWLDAPSAQA